MDAVLTVLTDDDVALALEKAAADASLPMTRSDGFDACLLPAPGSGTQVLILQLQTDSDVAGCLNLMHALDSAGHEPVILLFEKLGSGRLTFATTDAAFKPLAGEAADFFRRALTRLYTAEHAQFRPAALEHELLENSMLGREAALMEILRGCSSKEIDVYRKLYRLDLRSHGYYLFFWELQRTEYHNHYVNKDVYNLMGRILEKKYMQVLSQYEGGEEFRVNLDRRCIIINDLSVKSEAARNARLEELIAKLVSCGNCKTSSCYISERVDTLDNIRFARDRYENEKSSIFFLRYDGIIRADKVRRLKSANNVSLSSVLPGLQKIASYIKYDIQNPLLAMELHRLYFDVIKPSMSYTLYYYCLADICSQLVKAGGAEGIGVLTESLTPELMRFSSIEEQYDIMIHFITQFAARPSNQRKNRSAIVMGAVEYINEHYSQELTVPEIAEALYVSHMYLSKVFHSIMGKSVISYIVATRIDKAKTLLEETDTPVYEIAESVGFRDSKHFSKTFKSIVGVSPMEYRRLERGKQQ